MCRRIILQDTVDWGSKWFVNFNTLKRSNTGAIDMKMDAPVLEEKSSFKMLDLTFSSKLDWNSYIFSIVKTASKKLEP